MKHWQRPTPLVRAAFACAMLGVVMASCGDDDDSSTATTATTAAVEAPATGSSPVPTGDVCADREALRSSVDALRDVDVVAEGTNGVTAAVGDVKDALGTLRSSAGDELQPEVQAVQDAIDKLESEAANIGSGGGAAAVNAVSDVATSARTLLDSLDAGPCGESTTSTT